MFKLLAILSVSIVSSHLCDAYKILVVYPFPAKSHNALGNGVVRHLLKAGHEITYITPYPLTDTNPKLKQINVGAVKFRADLFNVQALMDKEAELSSDDTIFFSVLSVMEKYLYIDNVQKLLYDPNQKFDIVVAEWMFNEIAAGYAATFDCPFVWVVPYQPYVNVLSLIDEAPNPAYVPHLTSNNVPPFNFIQRLQELYSQAWSFLLKKFYHSKYQLELYERVFTPVLAKKGRSLPAFEELSHSASMTLGIAHVSMGLDIPLPQNFKSIAGFHVDEVVKPLPNDLQNLMDNAKYGVIYFSLGSNLQSKDFPDSVKKDLIQMLGELDETILWKFEEEFKGLPKNIHVTKWAPQQSVLAHPNCKLFITHGGLLSTIETVHFGVPFIGIPFFSDQFSNVNRLVQKGSAKRVDISYSLAADLKDAIKEITSDLGYTERARELSMIYHDRPVSPGAELVHWVEHVVRTRGAPHLRSPALHVPWYQKMYLDLAACILVIIIIIKYFISSLLKSCLKKKPVQKNKKTK